MTSFLMIGSLALGLIAWILPIINISRYRRNYNKNWAIYYIASISACAIAICFQIIETNRVVKIRDWSTIMDTVPTSTLLSIILLIVTLILNGVSVGMYHTKNN